MVMLRQLFVVGASFAVQDLADAVLVSRSDAEDRTCDDVWASMACSPSNECYDCGSRINYMINTGGLSSEDARQSIADQFWNPCGPCSATYREDINLGTAGYSTVWEDNFDVEGAVDTEEWVLVNKGDGFGNNEAQFYTNRMDNSFVSDGTLKIRAIAENYEGREYTSAKLETKKQWLYGKFSVRSRLPGTARGTWAAHWMMPRDSEHGIWPRSGEMDIMEHVGYDTGTVHATVHTMAYHHSIGTQRGSSTPTTVTDWHTYTVEWTPDITRFALDGTVYHVFRNQMDGNTDRWPFDKAFYVILNLAVGGSWGGVEGIDRPAFETEEGQVMEVDWVRVEQLSKEPASTTTPMLVVDPTPAPTRSTTPLVVVDPTPAPTRTTTPLVVVDPTPAPTTTEKTETTASEDFADDGGSDSGSSRLRYCLSAVAALLLWGIS